MIRSTLCYIEQDGKYLLLHRIKKKKDVNEGKWIGVGGKLEAGETPEECVIREVFEETGLTLTRFEKRGEIYFSAQGYEDELMYLYTADGFTGDIRWECVEGVLKWVPFEEIFDLNLWEGDRPFLRDLMDGKSDIRMSLFYEGDKLIRMENNVLVDG